MLKKSSLKFQNFYLNRKSKLILHFHCIYSNIKQQKPYKLMYLQYYNKNLKNQLKYLYMPTSTL